MTLSPVPTKRSEIYFDGAICTSISLLIKADLVLKYKIVRLAKGHNLGEASERARERVCHTMLKYREVWTFTALVVVVWSHRPARYTVDDSPSQLQDSFYCVPESWQGGRASTIGVVSRDGQSTVTMTMGQVLYSATLQKMLVADYLPIMGGETKTYLFDYPAHILYTVTNDTVCVKTPLPGPFQPQCVPDNSSMTMIKSYYGVQDNVQFVMELSGTQSYVNYRVSMTYSRVPVFEELWGAYNGETFFQTLAFYNFTITPIPDIAFKPPSVCDNVTYSQTAKRVTHSIKDKLITSVLLF